jgi:hypothetical protein
MPATTQRRRPTRLPPTPTEQTYGPLQAGFTHFSRELFANALPHCLITLRANGRAAGYFARDRFAALDGEARTDEIAMNAQLFRVRPARETASTLVHEMAHLWQAHFGKPPRKGYHDRQWATKMIEVGLMPSDTGAPGGRNVGYRMTHYILDDGAFAASFARFAATGQTLSWGDAAQLGAMQPPRQTRVKFVCPACGDACWGKETLDLSCNGCRRRLVLA